MQIYTYNMTDILTKIMCYDDDFDILMLYENYGCVVVVDSLMLCISLYPPV